LKNTNNRDNFTHNKQIGSLQLQKGTSRQFTSANYRCVASAPDQSQNTQKTWWVNSKQPCYLHAI